MPPRWFPQNVGAGAKANPSFVVGAAGTAAAITLTGLKAGDLVIGAVCGTSNSPSIPAGWWLTNSALTVTAGVFLLWFYRIVTPQDGTTVTLPSNLVAGYAAAAFRGVLTTDGISTGNTGVSAAPDANAFVTTVANDIVVNLIGWGSGSGSNIYSPSTGFTIAANKPAVNGTNFGVAIEYQLGQAAGTIPASSGAALGASNDWGMVALALHP